MSKPIVQITDRWHRLLYPKQPTATFHTLLRLSIHCWKYWLASLCLIALSLYTGRSVVLAQAHSSLKTILVAVDTTTPPFVEENLQGELTGYSIDLIKALAADADLQVNFEKTQTDEILAGVATQSYDAAIGCIFVSEERQQLVNFSDSYLTTGFVLVVRESSTITTPANLMADMNVGITQDGSDDAQLRQIIPSKYIPAITVTDILDQTAAGVLDAAVVDEFNARNYIKDHPDAQLRVLPETLTTEHCAIAVNKQETWLLSKINQSLANLKNNQSFDKLYSKWFSNRLQSQQFYTPPSSIQPNATTDTPAINGTLPADAMQQLAGVYYLSFQPSSAVDAAQNATQVQIVTLSADGLWLASQAIQANQSITTGYTIHQVQGVWHATTANQLRATVISFQQSVKGDVDGTSAAGIVRLDYTMEVKENGQVSGTYAQYGYELNEDPTIVPTQPVQPLQFSGHRLQVSE